MYTLKIISISYFLQRCLLGKKFVCSHFVALDAVSDVLTGEQSVPLMPPMSTLWDNTTPHPFLVKRGQFSALIVFVLDVALMSISSLWWSLCTRSDISFCAHQFDVATNKTTMKMASFGAAEDGSEQRHCVFCVCFCTCFCIFTCINPWWWHYGRQHAVWMDGTITSCLRRQFSRRWGTPSFLSPGWHLLTFLSLACPVVFLYLELWLYLYLFLHLQTYICDRFLALNGHSLPLVPLCHRGGACWHAKGL